MKDSSVFRPLPSGHVLPPPATFPSQVPPQRFRPLDADPSVASEDYQTVSIHGWAIHPGPDPFIEDPIAFEFDDKPFTTNPELHNVKSKDFENGDRPGADEKPRKKSSLLGTPKLSDREKKSSLKISGRNTEARSDAKPKKVGGCSSFSFGLVLGLNPVFLVIWVCWRYFRTSQGKIEWNERWLRYGQTLGLALIIAVAIVLIVVNSN